MLRSCATVDEAVTLLNEYQIPHLERAMLFFGDATGGSAIYEGDVVLRREDGVRHPVLTKFYQSRTPADEVKCWRKLKAEEIFTSLLDVEISKKMSDAGGIGLSSILLKQLGGQSEKKDGPESQ